MASSWPRFLYEEGRYDSNNPAMGLFKGLLLLHVSVFFLRAGAVLTNWRTIGLQIDLHITQFS